ncbi:S9 family peptidase [Balneola vulgaris]|jgi:dipeptidyl-peptidase-4|uniref:S9 family peptidase n=1 Tax=Balneola vulgaris TaxID=287535 RepID=UPI000362EC0B|nr:DPP IV N-terminal domain-containing protein [Balneola vulgaris]
MKRIFQSIAVLALLLSISTTAFSQSTGLELYAKMGQRNFVNFEGSSGVNWLPGNQGYMETERDDDGNVTFYKVNPKNQKRSALFNKKTVNALIEQYNSLTEKDVEHLPFARFEYVMDNNGIFFTQDKTDFVFNLKTRELRKLYKPEVEKAPYTDELMRGMSRSQLWNGTYSHDYTKFAYVKGYDIYVVDTATKEEKRLTYGSEEQMNGRPSWVYPEEFGQREAYWFSPDNSKIAYMQYNEKDVHQFPIVHELEFEAGLELMRYPKAGETNPTVKLFIVDIESGDIEEVPTNSDPDTYIVRPIWRQDGSELTFRRLNRQQNHLEFLAYNLGSQSVRTIFEEKEDAYINMHDNFIQLDDNQTFIWTSEVSGYNHIYHYDFNGKLINQITKGDFPVGSIVNVDQKNKKVYFSAYQNMGLDLYFYVVDMDGTDMKKLSKGEGRHNVSMNPSADYYICSHSSFDQPYEANMYTSNGKMVRNMMKADVSNVLAENLSKPEFFTFKAADGVTELPGLIYKPVDFNPNKEYPVVLPLYGGPESQDVSNTYKNSDGYQRLAQLGFIVVRANYRGSGNRGKEFATLHYENLGTLEIDDYAEAIKHVTKRPYADASRVGVYGHSYGGYATAMLMLRYPNLFHVGISGAPVTDWRSYDTIYTERYMNTPQKNKKGYDVGSAMTYADQLKGKLLLVHGSIDNNVHPANTTMLVDALIKAGKKFDLMMYPNNRHGIRGAHGAHYNKMRLNYLIEHLNPEIENKGEVEVELGWSN